MRTIKPSTLTGEITILPSKSYVHRILIAAAFADGVTEVVAETSADDVHKTAGCLRALGCGIEYENGAFKVSGGMKSGKETVTMDCGESGTTYRFMVPIVAALGRNCEFKVAGKLGERPMSDLLGCLTDNGMKIDNTSPLRISGKIASGDFRISGKVSSQYISGLLLALPSLDGDSKIIIDGKIASIDYVNITLDVLKQFGIKIERTDYGFFVPGKQTFKSPGRIVAESDWSNAAFFLAAGAISGDLTVKGLNMDSVQGDKAIMDVLQDCGADFKVTPDGISIKTSNLKGSQLDALHTPDMVPIASVIAANAKGETVIMNIERLRDKESDRLQATLEIMSALGVEAKTDGFTLWISGRTDILPSSIPIISGHNDHRIVMASAIAGLKTELSVTDPHAVKKSYPNFWEEYIRLGGVQNENIKP